MSRVTVQSVHTKEYQRLLTVRGQAGSISTVPVGRFALVRTGDELRVRNGSAARSIDLLGSTEQDWIPVEPTYRSEASFRIGPERFRLVFSEIETAAQLHGYQRLESFHYKGRVLNEDPAASLQGPKGTGGRKAVIIASIKVGNRTRIVGYIELQMPLMMCKPRHDLFTLQFHNTKRNISWSKWLGDGQDHVNLIVRIARVVVDPEFRGLGISSSLVSEAKGYAAARWSIGGRRPLFIEISAEMLRYVDFVTKAGFRYVGDTEGNLERIYKDLRDIEKGASGKSQIMSLQKRYHVAFSAYCKKTGRSFDEARSVLSELIKKNNPRDAMPSDEWLAFRPILRFPIPYFIAGLDNDASKYVAKCFGALKKKPVLVIVGSHRDHRRLKNASSDVELKISNLQVWVDQKLKLTPYVRLAMDSFGIDGGRIRTKLVGPADIDLVPGNVALIVGSSGAGKSVLLESLVTTRAARGLLLKTDMMSVRGKVGRLSPLPDGVPLLQYFGEQYGPERAFNALCRVGLSEAMVFIKPFELLSMGQRYRAMLADLLLRKADIWLLDEFCSNLDPINSAVISSHLRRFARRLRLIVVAAAANPAHFVDALMPDVIYVVRTGGDVHSLGMTEFKNGFYEKGV